MDKLEDDIETRTGLTQEKLVSDRVELSSQYSTRNNAFSNLDTAEAEQQIAEDTELYFDTKKALAKQRYITENTSKIRQLGISNSRINFQSKLTPTFIAFLTREEIIQTAKSSSVVEIGYYSEYDDDYVAVAPVEDPVVAASPWYTGVKVATQYNLALDKYGVTGEGIKILHIDHDYVRSDHDNFYLVPYPNRIHNVVQGNIYPVTDTASIPIEKNTNHANYCVAWLQSFAKDVEIYSVPTPFEYRAYNKANNTNINTFDDVEYAITEIGVDLINASCDQFSYDYDGSFAAKWHDAIIATYNIPLIASAGNARTDHLWVIAPASGYNSIAVGIYNYAENQMFNNYTFNPIAGGIRVAYKPDLVVAMTSGGGTSAGAPVVSAVVAMMMQLNPALKGDPEIVKAILMASCHEKADASIIDQAENYEENMEDGLTLKQGAGKLNALRALNIAAYKTYGYIVMPSTANSAYGDNISLNSEVYGNSTAIYPLNVSLAWLRKNTKSSNTQSSSSVALGTKHEFNLQVSYTNQNSSSIKRSETVNSGKQLVFYENPDLDKNYRIRVYRGTNDVNDGKSALCGYAYSVGNFEKMLERAEITGTTAIGKTLAVNAYNADGTSAVNSELSYQWSRSGDGITWQNISGATSSTYTLTTSDLNKYFKCLVVQDYLNDPEITKATLTRVVRYGDVDNDGAINSMDATMISQYLAEIITLTDEQMLAADVDGDGSVTSVDSTLIQQYTLGMIDCFPVEG